MKKLALALSLTLALSGATQAQTVPLSPHLFAINYWYYDYASGTDNFNARKDLVKAAGIKLVRLGGNAPNNKLALSDIVHFDLAIERVNSIGATPLMQLPMNLKPEDIPLWVSHFRDKGIKYWTLGNEPDPSSNFVEWYKGIPVGSGSTIKRENGNTYMEFRDKFVRLARAVKAADADAVVIGPDFRQWWGPSSSSPNPAEPLLTYYPAFIADVGALTENGVPLLDIFAFHFYGYHNEVENKKRVDVVQGYLDSVNQNRSKALRMAVGEVNAITSTTPTGNPLQIQPWGFDIGQFMVIMTKNVAAQQGEFVAPWSVFEGSGARGSTDFSTYNSNGTLRSSAVHLSLLANNRRDFLMAGAMENASYANQVSVFGMTDAGGSTVMLLNTSSGGRSYAVRLDDQFSTLAADVKVRFSSKNQNALQWAGQLPAKTTLMFTVDGNGRRLAKVEYNKAIADAASSNPAATPVVTDLTVGASVVGATADIVLSARLPAGAARSKVEFFVDGVLKGAAIAAPFELVLDSETLVNGTHALVVKAYDMDDNADSAAPVEFNIYNALNVTAQVSTKRSHFVSLPDGTAHGHITVKNATPGLIAGPLHVKLTGLPQNVTVLNASGIHRGSPYVTVDRTLNGHATMMFKLEFSNPSGAVINYLPQVLSGGF